MKLTTIILLIAIIVIIGAIGTVSAENIYTPILQTPTETGHVYIILRCQDNIYSKEIDVRSLDNPTDWYWILFVRPDGKTDTEFDPGEYHYNLTDGNAGHPEEGTFHIYAGWNTIVPILGHASGREPGNFPNQTPTPEPTATITPPPTESPTVTPTEIPTILPTAIPTTEPIVIPTTVPTTVPTDIPTTSPTLSPTITPLPTPVCHKEKVCIPGYWEYEMKLICGDNRGDGPEDYYLDCCRWVIVPVWHPEVCKIIMVCK